MAVARWRGIMNVKRCTIFNGNELHQAHERQKELLFQKKRTSLDLHNNKALLNLIIDFHEYHTKTSGKLK